MATSIFFNGRVISVPGSYSEVDASGLEQVGLGASGIVAVLGTAEGGRPASTIEEVKDLIRILKPEKMRTTFRNGDLREVGDMLFAPAKDPDILAGAQEVVAMKVNPATQSTAVLGNAQGDALDLTSIDYGAFTEQVNVSIAGGTTQGKLLTITFEDVVESVDDLGGDSIFTLKYDASGTTGSHGWNTTATAQVQAGGNLVTNGTRDSMGGGDGDITQPVSDIAMEVLSDNAGDVGQTVTIYGKDGTGAAVKQTYVLNGTTPVGGAQIFDKVSGFHMGFSEVTAGTVTVRATGGGATVGTMAAGTGAFKGLFKGIAMFANGALTLVSDGASVQDVIVAGFSLTGAVILEKITLTGTTPVVSVGTFSKITAIAVGEVEAGQTLTASAEICKSLASTQNTVQKMADLYNGKTELGAGFTFTIVTASTQFDPDNLDVMVAAANILDPAEPGFKADLYAIIAWINQNSQFISAARSSGASGGAPDDTAAPVFLSGGSEGTTTFAEWQGALNLLKKARINSIVVLTGDPAVHAALDAHCAYMGGIGRSERDGFAGALNGALTDVPTKDEYKSQAVDLNTRHIRLTGQAIERFNPEGERTEYLPPFTAAIAAGMQAGSAVGTSLTYKFANVLGFRQHSSWNPTDDSEEMIQGGLLIMENVEGVGRRWVRNVTTHLSSNNIAFIEGSVNEAVNFSVFNFRTNLEFAVGKKGFSGTINATKSIALNTLGLLVDAQVLVAFRSLDIELIVDVMEVSVEIAPVIPINFVKSTVHLVTVRQTAA